MIRLHVGTTGEVYEIPNRATAARVKILTHAVSYALHYWVEDKDAYIRGLQVEATDPRLAVWLQADILRRYAGVGVRE